MKLTASLFTALPRKALDQKLQNDALSYLAQEEPHSDLVNEMTKRVACYTFIETLRCLTLPNEQRNHTTLVRKKQLPEHPMNFAELRTWRQDTILALNLKPAVADLQTLIYRAHMLTLLTKMELSNDG